MAILISNSYLQTEELVQHLLLNKTALTVLLYHDTLQLYCHSKEKWYDYYSGALLQHCDTTEVLLNPATKHLQYQVLSSDTIVGSVLD